MVVARPGLEPCGFGKSIAGDRRNLAGTRLTSPRRAACDLHRSRWRRLVAARLVQQERDDADARAIGAGRHERYARHAASAALAARVDVHAHGNESARASRSRFSAREPGDARARTYYQ